MSDKRRSDTPPFRAGDQVLVVGLGKSGVAAARFLLSLGLRVAVSEGGPATPPVAEALDWLRQQGVPCEVGGHSAAWFTAVDGIVVSPGVPLTIAPLAAAAQAGVPIMGELALAPAYLRTPVIAVTGTNGKSTVTTLIGELLAAAGYKTFVGGNLGVPLSDYLVGPQEADWVVLEVSSFQLDAAGTFCPQIGVLLNISPDHLDRYPDYRAYAAAKWRLFAHQRATDWALLNGADPEIARLTATAPPLARCLDFNGQSAAAAAGPAAAVGEPCGGRQPRDDAGGAAAGVRRRGRRPLPAGELRA
ncbi:MAG: Mur ligase family protein [Desulfurivibrio sp.]|nr:Mur ligase family protein [Desulfurivibrio sp.]